MPEQTQGIYGLIVRTLNGKRALPRDFHLPAETGSLYFADGARDGISYFHSAPGPRDKETLLRRLAEIAQTLLRNENGLAESLRMAEEFCKTERMLFLRDTVTNLFSALVKQMDIPENALLPENSADDTEGLRQLRLLRLFADSCTESENPETVKLGLTVYSTLTGRSIPVKRVLQLATCNEFTLFAIPAILRRPNGMTLLAEAARNVWGWGRIFAVESMDAESEDAQSFLISEGCRNDIMPQYSALTVYRKANLRRMLRQDISDNQLEQIAFILSALLAERAVPGIRAVRDADLMLLDFLSQTKQHMLTLGILELVLAMLRMRENEEVRTVCDELLHCTAADRLVRRAYAEGKARALARYLGIEDTENG